MWCRNSLLPEAMAKHFLRSLKIIFQRMGKNSLKIYIINGNTFLLFESWAQMLCKSQTLQKCWEFKLTFCRIEIENGWRWQFWLKWRHKIPKFGLSDQWLLYLVSTAIGLSQPLSHVVLEYPVSVFPYLVSILYEETCVTS